jgi:hypothetical protein
MLSYRETQQPCLDKAKRTDGLLSATLKAPIEQGAVAAIVDYLSSTKGAK